MNISVCGVLAINNAKREILLFPANYMVYNTALTATTTKPLLW